MRAGTISVSGDAGAFAGSGRAGAMKGMSGGCIVIRGNAGDRAGDRMRRGLLLIEGSVGSYCAARMLAGTIVALGRRGNASGLSDAPRHRAARRRRAEPLPTFNDNGVQELLAIRLLLESLSQYGPAFRRFAKQQRVPALAGRSRVRWAGRDPVAFGLKLNRRERRGPAENSENSA